MFVQNTDFFKMKFKYTDKLKNVSNLKIAYSWLCIYYFVWFTKSNMLLRLFATEQLICNNPSQVLCMLSFSEQTYQNSILLTHKQRSVSRQLALTTHARNPPDTDNNQHWTVRLAGADAPELQKRCCPAGRWRLALVP